MAADTPAAGQAAAAPAYLAAHAAAIAAMDCTPIGPELAASVVKKLQDMAEEPHKYHQRQAMIAGGGQHVGYCGIGVWYKKDAKEFHVGRGHAVGIDASLRL